MLELKKVSCSLGGRRILRDVSFSAREGEILVILGKNGSGKTTLLRCVGSRLPFQGEILENGVPLRALPPGARARSIGLLPQVLPVPAVKAEELALFGRNPYMGVSGIPSQGDREAANKAMETAAVTAFRGRYVNALSGGERQRCFFAMLLAQNPRIVLLDEPTANLDTEYRELLYKDLQALKREGKTLVLVMHHLSEACRIADRICVLHEGAVHFLGSPEAFAESSAVSRVFSMRVYSCTGENGEALRFFSAL